MTSNLGSKIIQDHTENEVIKREVNQLLFQHFKPEFINRIDEIITFQRLDQQAIFEITQLQLKHLEELLKAEQISLTISEDAIRFLSKKGFDPRMGARPLKRAIQRELEDKLSLFILNGQVAKGDTITVKEEGGSLSFINKNRVLKNK